MTSSTAGALPGTSSGPLMGSGAGNTPMMRPQTGIPRPQQQPPVPQPMMPGAPNIYYGDEIGLFGKHDPHCRGAFPWEDEASWNKMLRAELKDMIQLRKEYAVLRRGQCCSIHADHDCVVYQRQLGRQTAIVAFNRAHEARQVSIHWPHDAPGQLACVLGDCEEISAETPLNLPPRSGQVWIG